MNRFQSGRLSEQNILEIAIDVLSDCDDVLDLNASDKNPSASESAPPIQRKYKQWQREYYKTKIKRCIETIKNSAINNYGEGKNRDGVGEGRGENELGTHRKLARKQGFEYHSYFFASLAGLNTYLLSTLWKP